MNRSRTAEQMSLRDRAVDFRLEVQMRLQYLTSIRRTVCDMTQAVVQDADLASRLALATHELLENALKYAVDEHQPVTLKLWVDAGGQAQVEVENASTLALFQNLQAYIHKLQSEADPVESYHRLLAASMHQTTGSGLGLARILAESEMTLGCTLSEAMTLTVRADAGGSR